ncbi:TPA: hypothetical protein OW314_006110 [Pseudomonas aeruginosa]|nr:hypothetical protein [Pseudomonas aeruginosa]HCW0232501.1 hypothetical protein [Pseudomonas aeruginosa]HCW0346819.1 hypothetical protein [Pseudomonas aeruginosa]
MTDVKRYDCTNGGYRHCQGCYEMTETPLGDYVRSEDYDALAAKLAMAEDAAAKGDAARQQCGGMEMEIEELRAELAELRARVVVVPDAANDRRKSAHYCRGWNACLDELARLNGLTVSESALDTLRKAASGEVKHLNNGLCPDAFEGHEARDPDCPVCRALLDTES